MPKAQRQFQKQKRVLILHMGGTIGMGPGSAQDALCLEPLSGFSEALVAAVPELWRLASIEVLALTHKDSSEHTSEDWVMLARTSFAVRPASTSNSSPL